MDSSNLAATADELRTVANRLEDAAERHAEGARELETLTSALDENWESPDGSEVIRYGGVLGLAVASVPTGLESAAEAARTLAGSADELAEELAVEERNIRDANSEIAGLLEPHLDAPHTPEFYDDIRNHSDPARDLNAARSRIEEIQNRWWGACETCSGHMHGALFDVSTPQSVGIGQRAMTGIIPGMTPSTFVQLALAFRGDGSNNLSINGDEAVITGSDENDKVEVEERDGQLVVVITNYDRNGNETGSTEHPLPDDVTTLTIRTGDGNDVVSIPPEVADHIEITVNTGDGSNMVGYINPDAPMVSMSGGDGINIVTGDDPAGNNVLYGTHGDDRIVAQGGGHDDVNTVGGDNVVSVMGGGQNRIQGGNGDDIIRTGDGNDYIDASGGTDFVETSGGDNTLVAGEGDGDHLIGGNGDDTFIAGRDETHIASTGGDDVVYWAGEDDGRHTVDNQGGSLDTVQVVVDGRPGDDAIELVRPEGVSDQEWEAWTNRVESDMEMIRHTPAGQEGLNALDDIDGISDAPIQISPTVADGGSGDAWDYTLFMENGSSHRSSYATADGDVGYDTIGNSDGQSERDNGVNAPRAIGLYHEFAHAYDRQTGNDEWFRDEYDEYVVDADGNEVPGTRTTLHSNDTWRASEINSVGYDLDGDGQISDDETMGDHPGALTEFELRSDLGVGPRTGYFTDQNDLSEGDRVVYEERE